jgi:photosystem II stability/assembly factor-like uncharacterized protein
LEQGAIVRLKIDGGVLAAAVCWFALNASAEFRDVLARPSTETPQARTSLQNGLSLAGGRLVSAGQRGHILYSDDRGRSWRQGQVPVSSDLVAVHFPTPLQGWAVGHDASVLHSVDGGATWALQFDGVRAARRMLDYYKSFDASAMDAQALAKLHADVAQFVEEGPDKPFLDVWFEDEKTGFIVGAFNLIFRTEDGGRTWEPWYHRTENPRGLHLYAIRPVGRDLVIVGEQGLVLKLDHNAGRFSALPTPYAGTYFGVIGTAQAMLVFGLRGNILRSTDGGKQWQQVASGGGAHLNGGTVAPDGRMVLVGQAGQVLLSTDHGATFAPLTMQQPMSANAVAVIGGTLAVAGQRGVRVQPLPPEPRSTAP